ncbi:uncharacterized protein [Medicago truncatula]|uniref:uncharacterized protein n=1 Tax=Medicago truncatula TaxID=3880 RepID=UPI001968667D|nr:uncharacterized protein LOC112420148 [Medicago truncatula]
MKKIMKKPILEEEDTIIEVKQDFMVSPSSQTQSTLRTAYFLKPIANFILNPPPPLSSSTTSVFDSKKRSFQIRFNGWRYPRNWVKWVDQLQLKYESLWKKVGIFDAIMSTKSCIKKDQNLLCGVVDKWCSETNTFVFPFGEATITLEDVMVLGGYPIIGDPIFKSLEDQRMKELEQKLINIEEKERVIKTMPPSTSVWMTFFFGKGSEIEHEAFLATWLSIFVFPHRYFIVKRSLFPIAIRLARGNTIALAPAVLASLYNDLSLFKKKIVDFKKFPLDVNLQSPFYLVQAWVWERFINLQPQPKLINNGDHVLLRWHKVEAPLKINHVRLALDSSTMDDFIWRPYVSYAHKCGMFYPNDEIRVPFKNDLVDKQMLLFVTCLRVSELVGFEFIEQYLPHRVARQFGFDQDVPGYVSRLNETQVIAWKNYTRPLSDTSLYFPSRSFKAGVTTCYEKWWEKSVLGPQGFVKNDVPRKRIASSKYRPHAKVPKLVGCGTAASGKSSDDGSKTSKGDNIVDDDVPKLVGCTVAIEKSSDDGSKTNKDDNNTIGKSSDDGFKTNKGDNIVDDDVPSDFVPKLVGCHVTLGKSSNDGSKTSNDGSKTSKGGIIVDNDVPSVQDGDGMKAGENIAADGGNNVVDDVPSVQDGMKAGGNIDADGGNFDDDVASVQDGMKIGGNIDVDGGNVVADDVPSGSIPEHLKPMSSENSVEDGLIGEKDVDSDAPSLPPKDNTLTPLLSVEDSEHVLEDGNESNDSRLSRNIIDQYETQTESFSYLSEVSIADLEQRISRLERVQRKLKRKRGKNQV